MAAELPVKKTEKVIRWFTALQREAVGIADRAIQTALFFVFMLRCQALLGGCWARVRRCQAPEVRNLSYLRHASSKSCGGSF